jgi:hypothetical protein
MEVLAPDLKHAPRKRQGASGSPNSCEQNHLEMFGAIAGVDPERGWAQQRHLQSLERRFENGRWNSGRIIDDLKVDRKRRSERSRP